MTNYQHKISLDPDTNSILEVLMAESELSKSAVIAGLIQATATSKNSLYQDGQYRKGDRLPTEWAC